MGVYTLGKPIASADLSGSVTRKVYISGDTPLANQIAIWVDENHITGSTIDTIETTLTNDDTHIPTSGAVYSAIANASNSINIAGTPIDNQIAIWTTSDTLEGASGFTYDGFELIAPSINTALITEPTSGSLPFFCSGIEIGGSALDATVKATVGTSAHPSGYNMTIKGGDSYSSGNGNGGDLILSGGSRTGYGTDGRVRLNNNLVFPDNTIQYGAVSKASISFGPTEIINNATGTLIPSPGYNTYIVPICFYIVLTAGVTAYSGSGPTITMKYGNTTTIASIADFNLTSAANQIAMLYPTTSINGDFSDLDNKPITVSISGGSLVDGDGWLNIATTYITISV